MELRSGTSFSDYSEVIVNNPTLHPPHLKKEFFMITDGSQTVISGILVQEENDYLLPTELFGQKLRDPEKNYPSLKFEFLAVPPWGNQTLKYILLGRKITVLADSKALTQHLHLQDQSEIVKIWEANSAGL